MPQIISKKILPLLFLAFFISACTTDAPLPSREGLIDSPPIISKPSELPITEPPQPSIQQVFDPVIQKAYTPPPAAKKIAPKVTEECHPSYSGCLNPDASDYDCAGGSGNGPYYTGQVQVIGPDVFDVDRDGNGWGCE